MGKKQSGGNPQGRGFHYQRPNNYHSTDQRRSFQSSISRQRRFHPPLRNPPSYTPAQINRALRHLLAALPAGVNLRETKSKQLILAGLNITLPTLLYFFEQFVLVGAATRTNIPHIEQAYQNGLARNNPHMSEYCNSPTYQMSSAKWLNAPRNITGIFLASTLSTLSLISFMVSCASLPRSRAWIMKVSIIAFNGLLSSLPLYVPMGFDDTQAYCLGDSGANHPPALPLPPDALPDYLTFVRGLTPYYARSVLAILPLLLTGTLFTTRTHYGVSQLTRFFKDPSIDDQIATFVPPLLEEAVSEPSLRKEEVRIELDHKGQPFDARANGAGGSSSSDVPVDGGATSRKKIFAIYQAKYHPMLSKLQGRTEQFLDLARNVNFGNFETVTRDMGGVISKISCHLFVDSKDEISELPGPDKLSFQANLIGQSLFAREKMRIEDLLLLLTRVKDEAIKQDILSFLEQVISLIKAFNFNQKTARHPRVTIPFTLPEQTLLTDALPLLEDFVINTQGMGDALMLVLEEIPDKNIVFESGNRFIPTYVQRHHHLPSLSLFAAYLTHFTLEQKQALFAQLMRAVNWRQLILENPQTTSQLMDFFDEPALLRLIILKLQADQLLMKEVSEISVLSVVCDRLSCKIKNLLLDINSPDANRREQVVLSVLTSLALMRLAISQNENNQLYSCVLTMTAERLRLDRLTQFRRSFNLPESGLPERTRLIDQLPRDLRVYAEEALRTEGCVFPFRLQEGIHAIILDKQKSAASVIESIQQAYPEERLIDLFILFITRGDCWGMTESIDLQAERIELQKIDLFAGGCLLDCLGQRYLRMAAIACFLLAALEPAALEVRMTPALISRIPQLQGTNLILILLASRLSDFPDKLTLLLDRCLTLADTHALRNSLISVWNFFACPINQDTSITLPLADGRALLERIIEERHAPLLPWGINREQLRRIGEQEKSLSPTPVEEVEEADPLLQGTPSTP